MNNFKRKYRWFIIGDHLSKEHVCDGKKNRGTRIFNIPTCHYEECDAGTYGPYPDCYDGFNNSKAWKMYDDDNILYYSGVIYGDYTGFEPLDDYGTPYAGCSEIWINGERL